jgi:hypothetical protein
MMLLFAIALAANLDADGGPSPSDLAEAIQSDPDVSGPVKFGTDTIRSLQCRAFEEEPTEYRCRFKAWAIEGRWKRRTAIVALDGRRWVLLSLE